ncbi:MAG: hypothetical protein DMG11_11400 [Acidobacteria bacterium]|nr:MAG: hypothetical protein DMG11_11400 [Acidobacteriota bacterium]
MPAGSHVAAEIHYRGAKERVVERGRLGLFFADKPAPNTVSSLVLEGKSDSQKLRAESRLAADAYALALRPEIGAGVKSVEVSARKPDGGTEILLFAKDIPLDWPTPYVFKEPVLLRRGTVLSATAYSAQPGRIRLTVTTASSIPNH